VVETTTTGVWSDCGPMAELWSLFKDFVSFPGGVKSLKCITGVYSVGLITQRLEGTLRIGPEKRTWKLAGLVPGSRIVGSDLPTWHRFWAAYGLFGSYGGGEQA
jgi:hypothetical protein